MNKFNYMIMRKVNKLLVTLPSLAERGCGGGILANVCANVETWRATSLQRGLIFKSLNVKSLNLFVLLLFLSTKIFAQFAGGNGTPGSPYQITTAAHLEQLAAYVNSANAAYNDKHYILMNDITLPQTVNNLTPIGNTSSVSFKGNFNGAGKKITGLKINTATLQYVALFGRVDGGAIQNLGIENAEIVCNNSTNVFAGGLAGSIVNSTISNCYTTGAVNINSGGYIYAGGMVGATSTSTISNCYSTIEVSATTTSTNYSYAGGIAGRIWGTISNCYATGAVSAISAGHSYAGGIAGCDEGQSGTISNCYATGAVSSLSTSTNSGHRSCAGGIAGRLQNSGSTISLCAALNSSINCTGITKNFGRVIGDKVTNVNLTSNIAFADMLNPDGEPEWNNTGGANLDGEDYTAEQINSNPTLEGRFPLTNGWTTAEGKLPGLFGNTVNMPPHLTSPFEGKGTANNPYLIETHEQLALLATLVNAGNTLFNKKHYRLVNDIDLSNYQANEGWIPIGNSSTNSFKGNFNGAGKKITGLKINTATLSDVGLFGRIDGGTIQNLGIENADIVCNRQSSALAGGVAGLIDNSTISNCYTTGEVIINAAAPCAGGIVGAMSGSGTNTISNCYSTIEVSATGTNNTVSTCAGGIAGTVRGTISNCYATGTVSAVSAGESFAGGIAGYDGGGSSSAISNCYSTGAVSSISTSTSSLTYSNAGGIMGRFGNGNSTISNCAALNSSINCTGITKNFGRVIGYIHGGNVILSLSSNIAFADMLNPAGETNWNNIGIQNLDGANFTKEQINTDRTLGDRFTPAGGWTVATRKLPGLFGKAVNMPPHLKLEDVFGGGTGNDDDPFLIETHEHLAQLALFVNSNNALYNDKYYQLMNHIDLSDYQTGAGWTPIGNSYCFKGHFDGNNNKITGLVCKSASSFAGLFGCVSEGSVKNLGIENALIETDYLESSSGIIAGVVVQNSIIDNCYTSGTMNFQTDNAFYYAGGIAGSVDYNSKINNSNSTITINSNGYVVYFGGIAGRVLINSDVSNCRSAGEITVTGSYYALVGGIAATVQSAGKISKSWSTATITVNGVHSGAAAGIAGNISLSSTVEHCYSTGDISIYGDDNDNEYSTLSAGGITGVNSDGCTVKNCWASGAVTATGVNTPRAGGITAINNGTVENCAALNPQIFVNATTGFGRIAGTGGTFTNNIAFAEMLNPAGEPQWQNTGADNLDGEDITALEIHLDGSLGSRFTGANGWIQMNGCLPGLGNFTDNTVAMPAHLKYFTITGSGDSEDDPFLISTAEQLAELSLCYEHEIYPYVEAGKFFKLVNDIDLSDYQAGEGWKPIGQYGFNGNFDGNNKKITGLKINSSTLYHAGLFHILNPATLIGITIKNLGIENAEIVCNFTGSVYAGGIAGETRGSVSIINCYTTGTITVSSDNGLPYAGGITGKTDRNSILDNCYSTMSINITKGSTSYSGGIVGNTGSYNTISNCYAETEKVAAVAKRFAYSGGIVGYVNSNSVISNCYAIAAVTALSDSIANAGGIAGYIYNSSNVSNCYSTGTVNAESNVTVGGRSEAGGIAGYYGSGVLSNSYSAMEVSSYVSNGNSYAGGIVARSVNTTIFYNAALNPSINCSGTVVDFGRVFGIRTGTGGLINGNIAFADMLNPAGEPEWQNKGTDNLDGIDFSKQQIHADGTLGNRFEPPVWTTQNGKLPGLFGNTVEMPAHLLYTAIAVETVSGLRVYPNPTDGQLKIKNNELNPEIYSGTNERTLSAVEVFDVSGRNVFTSSLSLLSPETILDISHLPAGVYFLRVGNEMVKVVKK